MPKIAIASIVIGERKRKQLGDIAPLANSLSSLGLLHPIVLSGDHRLIAGARRIAAAQSLGWKEIDYTIPVSVHDYLDTLKAERDENTCREPFLPSEAVAVAAEIEAMEAEEAAKRMKSGVSESPGTLGEFPLGSTPTSKTEGGKSKARAAKAVDMDRKTLSKAQKVVAAAKEDPAKFGDLTEKMDTSGKVDPAYKELQRRQAGKPATETLDEEGCSDPIPGPTASQQAFQNASAIDEALKFLTKITKTINELVGDGKPGATHKPGGELLFRERNKLAVHLKNAREILNATKPHAVCPYCLVGKKDCSACKGCGWVCHSVFDSAPPELKSKVKPGRAA